MNTKSKIDGIVDQLKDIFTHKSEKEEIEFETRMIMYRFLSEVELIMIDRNITKKDLAIQIGTSPSYLTQLFRGDKILNLATIAKLQKALNISFVIKAKPELQSDLNIQRSHIDLKTQKSIRSYQVKHHTSAVAEPAKPIKTGTITKKTDRLPAKRKK